VKGMKKKLVKTEKMMMMMMKRKRKKNYPQGALQKTSHKAR
jgi:hypothetical protein